MADDRSILADVTAHTVLRAEDLDRAKAFYSDVLGLDVRDVGEGVRELRVRSGAAMICIYERPAMPAPANTVACFEVADIEAAVGGLRDRGVVFENYDMPAHDLLTVDGIAEVHGDRRAWFKDSEGNTLVVAQPAPASEGEGTAWDDVIVSVGGLGEAISRWAGTATDDPENRRRLEEVRAGMDDMARQAQETFEDIDRTEFGRQVRVGVQETGRVVGDAAQKVSDAAAPHVALIFAGLADAFGKAAAGVDESVKRKEPAAPESEAQEGGGADDGQRP